MATPFSSVDPLAVQAQRINTAQIDPSAPAQAIQAGVAAGTQTMQFELAKQFQRLLQAGQEGRLQVFNKLMQSNQFAPGELPDPNDPAFQNEQGNLAYYQGIAQIVKEKERAAREARFKTELVAAPPEERQKVLLEYDKTKPEKFVEETGKMELTEDEKKAESFIAEMILEKLDPDKPGEDIKITKSEAFKNLAEGGHARTKVAEEFIKTIEDPEAKLEEWLWKRGITSGEKRFDAYLKIADKVGEAATGVVQIDRALKDGGVENGIYGEANKGFGVIGFGTKAFRKWINSDDGVKLRQAINMFMLGKVKEQSGAQVSVKEFEKIENAFALNTRSTIKAFLESMKDYNEGLKNRLNTPWITVPEDKQQLIIEGGGIYPGMLPSPEKVIKKIKNKKETKPEEWKTHESTGYRYRIKGK